MQERCAGDVVICKALWRFLQPDGYSREAIELEHRAADDLRRDHRDRRAVRYRLPPPSCIRGNGRRGALSSLHSCSGNSPAQI